MSIRELYSICRKDNILLGLNTKRACENLKFLYAYTKWTTALLLLLMLLCFLKS